METAMNQNTLRNRQVLLNSRLVGAPVDDNFCLVETAIPQPAQGQTLLCTLYLSLAPICEVA